MEKLCKNCGKKMTVKPSQYERKKFCSRKCKGEYQSKNPEAFQHLKKALLVKCTNCGVKFEKKLSVIKKWNFCNKECMALYYSKSQVFSGENSPTWKGGDIDYYGPNWWEQRRKARERDHYTCQACGITEEHYGQELFVHHIVPFREFNGDWKEANKLSNLVSLCEYPCHRKRHSKDNN